MKLRVKIIAVLFGLILCRMVSPAYSEYLLSTGVRYDTFSDDRSPGDSGLQVTIPLGFAYKQERYSISMETAYSSATADPAAESDVSLSSFTDTLFSVSYTYSFPNRAIGIIAGVDLNLPTGKEDLSERERIAEVGESNDLFEVDNFGDGLNIGLSLGIVGDIGKISLGIQGGYIFNGEFDPTRDVPNDDLDPGDQLLGLVLFGWQASTKLMLDAFIAYSYFFSDKVTGQEIFREGDNVVIGGNILYERAPVSIAISLQGATQSKNEEVIGETLQTEPENSNGTDFFGLAEMAYYPLPKLNLRLLGDIRYYGESDRKDGLTGLPYEGQRIRYAIGPGFVYNLNQHISCNGLLKYFTMTQERDITVEQELTFQGINLEVGFTYTF